MPRGFYKNKYEIYCKVVDLWWQAHPYKIVSKDTTQYAKDEETALAYKKISKGRIEYNPLAEFDFEALKKFLDIPKQWNT